MPQQETDDREAQPDAHREGAIRMPGSRGRFAVRGMALQSAGKLLSMIHDRALGVLDR